ncbi:MBL fold metallo-hydrolase [Brevibacterium linens]|uniref:MBL fold metallo-hydrolase n=1 Tax=Brevibacterium linens TaxID=1703 RepID=UPI003BF54FFC
MTSTPRATTTNWFQATTVTPGVTRLEETHVHELLRANIWHVRGADRDLVMDAGLGVVSLRERLPELFVHDPILVLSHGHLDHVGSAYEFSDRRMHPATRVGADLPATLNGPELMQGLGIRWPEVPELLLERLPHPDYDPQSYCVPEAPATGFLKEGDLLDLGDREFRVIHLPGHTPGSLCLFDEVTGALFSGDVVYDDTLLDELHESSIEDYVRSMHRLRELPVCTVFPGHGAPFGATRMRAVIDDYLHLRGG